MVTKGIKGWGYLHAATVIGGLIGLMIDLSYKVFPTFTGCLMLLCALGAYFILRLANPKNNN